MEFLKNNYKIENFGEIYLLIKLNLLTIKDVLNLADEGKINKCTQERTILLNINSDDLFTFITLIKDFVIEDKGEKIIHNEDLNDSDNKYIPLVYWEIYKLELILRLEKLRLNKEEMLDQLAVLYNKLNFPQDWENFINYLPSKSNKIISVESLYDNFLKYKQKLIEKYI